MVFRLNFQTTDLVQAELILDAMGASAVYITSNGDLPIAGREAMPQYGDRLEAYFETEPDIAPLLPVAVDTIACEHIGERDWVSESQQNLPLVLAPPFAVYGAHARPKRRLARIGIELEAGAAFGSGHHATTQGCLSLIGRAMGKHPNLACLDVGSGSGILAIAMAKLRARYVVASDIDPVAQRVTQANARANGCNHKIQAVTAIGFHHPLIRARGQFDIIAANILASPLKQMAPQFAHYIRPNGAVIVSGLLKRQAAKIQGAFRAHGLHLVDRENIDDWTAMTFRL
jgi:ribosomal protein L11 methyltransferase